eukprot:m.720783 g.720783  ORF g.720783 m.720783 type:complete len:54 (-) comp23008_c0_seq4:155-316(-)
MPSTYLLTRIDQHNFETTLIDVEHYFNRNVATGILACSRLIPPHLIHIQNQSI